MHHQNPSLRLSRAEAVAAVLVACASVDGLLRAEEATRLKEVLASSRGGLGTAVDVAAELTTRALKLMADHGVPAVLAACAAAIPAELHATTFALAMDVALADGRLGSRENALVDQLQAALAIDVDLARKITDVLLIKNRMSGRPDP